MFGNARAKLPAHIKRWGMRLIAFKFRVIHVRGEDNISDYLSRHPRQSTNDNRLCRILEEYNNSVIYHVTPKAISLDDIGAEKKTDTTQYKVLTALQTDWREANNDNSYDCFTTSRHQTVHSNSIVSEVCRNCTQNTNV